MLCKLHYAYTQYQLHNKNQPEQNRLGQYVNFRNNPHARTNCIS